MLVIIMLENVDEGLVNRLEENCDEPTDFRIGESNIGNEASGGENVGDLDDLGVVGTETSDDNEDEKTSKEGDINMN